MVVVSDTSVLSNFFLIKQLELLRLVFGQIVVPEKVFQELSNLASFGHSIDWLESADWITVQSVSEKSRVIPLLSVIDEGEAEAIVLAQELHADYILIDDFMGRQIAAKHGLTVIGSVGILLKAKQQGYALLVRPLMDDLMTVASAYIAPRLYSEILSLADEQHEQ